MLSHPSSISHLHPYQYDVTYTKRWEKTSKPKRDVIPSTIQPPAGQPQSRMDSKAVPIERRHRATADGKPRSASPGHRDDGLLHRSLVEAKPCCVCKDEKSKRDECMLFSNASDPAADCQSLVDKYKTCMLSYGFKV
ncbi:hypothetical protein DCS_08284 [Drechmeria coniospora]|uniref:Cytochrome c oxidase copper chaperone n=1 Tax=Drechmeria coniospora TaxID=98403 RepID=A0A151GA23_DRECN|nr:uncharacterized protein DCS_08284 [Drechmeria coniospora]KYK53944.1 hypothetical protein DCS_08284 [Drechmeria coniospora]